MLHIGICDDEEPVRQALQLTLTKLLRESASAPAFYAFSSGEGVIGWLSKHEGELDILFLDIEMHGINGMETARLVREQAPGLVLCFVTGYADYVFDGYSVGALGYLLKPVSEQKLRRVLERAMGALHLKAPQTYTVKNAQGIYRVPKENILYFYSERRQVRLVTANREIAFYAKLDSVQDEVGDSFVRIHQRYLVRADAVEKVEGGGVALAGQKLPISRACRQDAMAAFVRAMLRSGGGSQ